MDLEKSLAERLHGIDPRSGPGALASRIPPPAEERQEMWRYEKHGVTIPERHGKTSSNCHSLNNFGVVALVAVGLWLVIRNTYFWVGVYRIFLNHDPSKKCGWQIDSKLKTKNMF